MVTWTATDSCGNATNRSQTIVVVDTTSPLFLHDDVPISTIECGTALVWTAPGFSDSCNSLTVVSNLVISGSACRQTNMVTWTATDSCGNATNRSQTIVVVDTTAPAVTASQGPDTTIECGT